MLEGLVDLALAVVVGVHFLWHLMPEDQCPDLLITAHRMLYVLPVAKVREHLAPEMRGKDMSAGLYWTILLAAVVLAR